MADQEEGTTKEEAVKILWTRCDRVVFLYGMHRNAIGAMHLLKLNAPAVEVKVLDEGKDITIPVRELDFDYDHVRDHNGYDANGSPV